MASINTFNELLRLLKHHDMRDAALRLPLPTPLAPGVNGLFATSLFIILAAVSLGLLTKVWLTRYDHDNPDWFLRGDMNRPHYGPYGLELRHMLSVTNLILTMLAVAMTVFMIGLAYFLWNIQGEPIGYSFVLISLLGMLFLWIIHFKSGSIALLHPTTLTSVIAHSAEPQMLEDSKTSQELESGLESLNNVAYSNDGSYLVSTYAMKAADIKNSATGETVMVLEGHSDLITAVACSPGGSFVALGSRDSTIKTWNPKTGVIVHTLHGHTRGITSLHFSSDESLLASGSNDFSVRIWSLSLGANTHTLLGHHGFITSVLFSPDGRRIASASLDMTIRVWNVSTGDVIQNLSEDLRCPTSLAFSPNGSHLVSCYEDHTVRLRDITSGAELGVLQGRPRNVNIVPETKPTTNLHQTQTFDSPPFVRENDGVLGTGALRGEARDCLVPPNERIKAVIDAPPHPL